MTVGKIYITYLNQQIRLIYYIRTQPWRFGNELNPVKKHESS